MSSSIRLHVRLTPKAAQNKIQGWVTDETGQEILKVGVTAVPEKGKANEALIALLAKTLKIPKSDIEIVRGETDRNKVLALRNVSESDLKFLIKLLTNT